MGGIDRAIDSRSAQVFHLINMTVTARKHSAVLARLKGEGEREEPTGMNACKFGFHEPNSKGVYS
jgi:hypothetical protein